MTEFDPLAHAREKARRYEAEVIMLREMNDKLFRLVALAARRGDPGADRAEPALTRCGELEEMDAVRQEVA